MKPFSLRGLAVLTALLLVPLLAVSVSAQQTTWYFSNTGMEVSKVFDLPCGYINAQTGETLSDSMVVMCLRFANTSNPSVADVVETILVESNFSDSGMVEAIELWQEGGAAAPTGPGDFSPGEGVDVLLATATFGADVTGTHSGADGESILTDGTASWTVNQFVNWTIYNTTDGSSGTITANTATTVTVAGAATGTHSAGNDEAVLTDATANWVAGELVGTTIYNTTDGSSGSVTGNTATTVTAVLAGGTEDDWDTGDAYSVSGLKGGTDEDWDNGDAYTISSGGFINNAIATLLPNLAVAGGDSTFVYIVVNFDDGVVGDVDYRGASFSVEIDGTDPGIVCTNAGDGPNDVDGPGGNGDWIRNDNGISGAAGYVIGYLETMTVPYYFDADSSLRMGVFDIVYTGSQDPRKVVNGAATNKVVMGIILDNSRSASADQLTGINFRSRIDHTDAISRIAVYRENQCMVPTGASSFGATDVLWAENTNPGNFDWGGSQGDVVALGLEPGVGSVTAGEILYLYVVVDLNEAVINASQQSRDDFNWGLVGIALNNSSVVVTTPEAFTFSTSGTGPIASAGGNRVVVYNPLTTYGSHSGADDLAVLEDDTKSWNIDELIGLTIYNTTDVSSGVITDNDSTTVTVTLAGGTDNDWDTDDEYYFTFPPGQPLVIDSKPPIIECLLAPFDTTWPSWEHSDDGGDQAGYGVGTIDNLDNVLVRFKIYDEGPAALDVTSPDMPRVDLRVFGVTTSTHVNMTQSAPGAVDLDSLYIWEADVTPILARDALTIHRTDTLSGNKKLEVLAEDEAENEAIFLCPVLRNIDTRQPSFTGVGVSFDFVQPGGDVNGDGVAAIGDMLRLTVAMGDNWRNWNRADGQGVEIVSLVANFHADWGFTSQTLTDPSGDNQNFSVDFTLGPGGWDSVVASAAVTACSLITYDNADNMRMSEDELGDNGRYQFAGLMIDNRPPTPIAANCYWTLYAENPSNNVVNIGDEVRLRIDMDAEGDIDSIWTDLFVAGLGGNHVHTLSDSGGNIWTLNWTVLDPRLNNSTDYAVDEVPHTDVCPTVPYVHGGRDSVAVYMSDIFGNMDTLWLGYPSFPHLENTPAETLTVDTKVPPPVSALTATPGPDGSVVLDWTTATDGVGAGDLKDGPWTYEIWWDGGEGADPDDSLATLFETTPSSPCAAITQWRSDTTVAMQANFTCGETYRFKIKVRDNANNMSDWSTTVAVTTDCAAPTMCVFQPEEGGLFSCDMCDWDGADSTQGLTIYIQPFDEESQDVQSIGSVMVRLKMRGGVPGPWTSVSFTDVGASAPYTYALLLDCDDLDAIVGTELTDDLELVILGADEASNATTIAEAIAACGVWDFQWSTSVIEGEIVTINGDLPEEQPYCSVHGWEISGATNTVSITLTGGVMPYKARAFADDDDDVGSNDLIWYAEGLTSATTTFNLDATGWSKGEGTLEVQWCDATGAYTTTTVKLCILDEIAPCAQVVNPMDGKCIRRAHSVLDPVPVTVEIDPLANCLDPDGVVKIDYEWATSCCIGTYFDTQTTRDSVEIQCGPEDSAVCDTFWTGTFIDSINCVDPGEICWQIFFVLDTLEIDCDTADWNNFAIQPGDSISSDLVTAWWHNKDDLAWVTASGTIIYIRARVYDDQGNIFVTECVEVCVDIDTPPLCLFTDNECVALDGIPRLSGANNTLYAELNWAEGNVDDIEDLYLYRKKSTDADRWEHWTSLGAGVPAMNSTMWRWDGVDVTGLTDQVYYDFRVIAKTIWGTWSYDMNGDEQFDHNTFDTTNCDATTWFIDHSAENIWIDTVWTMIDGEELIQPNTSCTLSDPRGWAWTQYGNAITVQPLVEPLGLTDDIVKVTWTLFKAGEECYSCDCEAGFGVPEGTCDSKVVRINEGENALNSVTFDPSGDPDGGMAFWLTQADGYQTVILYVEAEDACGNTSSDCIELYLLDIDKTEAIIIDPKNHEVFCQDHENEGGGIVVTAQTLLDEYFTMAVFAYSTDGETWVPFDSVTSAGTNGNLSGMWYPHALGLADGMYYLTVWAEDDAGNRQENLYTITVYLSCRLPTVAMTYPTAEMFIGCPLELVAAATVPDDYNYITQVDFYYQPVGSATATWIGKDLYSIDGNYGVAWEPALNGDYYLWAQVTVKSGATAVSEKVWVSADATDPEVYIVQVNGDLSDGGSGDPTLVTAGDEVTIDAEAWDRLQADGYGPEDNCGLDKVMIYVQSGTTEIFGVQMTYVADNTFTTVWPTTGLAAGTYKVYAVATDGCCNDKTSDVWYVEVVNPIPEVTIVVDEAVPVCAVMSTNADEITITATADPEATVSQVAFYMSSTTKSDVFDQYTLLGTDVSGTAGIFSITVDISGWAEGTYRLRAIAGGGSFSDFTFAEANAWDMILAVDRSAPIPTFTLAAAVIAEGTMFEITVAEPPCGDCDIDHYEYGIVTAGGKYGTRAEYNTTLCEFSFDPVDSGAVTMSNCYWGGYVRVTSVDPLGNETYYQLPVEILAVEDGYAKITSPAHGAYVSDTVAIAASVVGTEGELVYYYSALGSTATTEIDNPWITNDVPDGEYLLWVANDGNKHEIECAVPVKVVNDCAVVELLTPIPSDSTCHPGNVRYIGGTVDLRAEVTLTSNVPVDSVVFKYKTLDAPGGHTDTGDPANGWVTLGSDRYKATSWDISWNTADIGKVVPDGYYVIMAFSYDRSGQECHSNSITLFVDNTKPFSEISEVNGDQTTETCADVTEGTNVEIVAVAVDDRSPLGPGTEYNSCPKYVQFFAGHCGEGATGAVDIVWVVDASGSMGDEQSVIGGQISKFVGSLGGLDYRLAVTAFESEGYFSAVNDSTKSVPMAHDGSYAAALMGTGAWTVVETTFNRMVTSVGIGGGTEDGAGSLMETLEHYTFRANARKFFILVTDESGDDNALEAETIALMQQEGVTVHVVSDPSFATYSNIAAATNGQVYNIASADWGALLAVLGSQISGAGSGDMPIDPIWGKVIDLDTDAPSVHWNTTGLAPGEYCLWTVITDKVGNQYTSALTTVCVYDKTPPVAWIAGFGDATVACPACDAHRIYAMTCDTDVEALKFEIRQADLTGELDWTTIGITTMIDSSLWYTDWDPCMLADDDYSLRAVPVSAHYATGTEEHINWDIDAAGNPILAITVANCSITYSSGDLNTLTFEDKSSGDLGIANLTSSSAINALRIGMLGIYQPLNEKTLTTERVNLVQMIGMDDATYLGNINDQPICQGGVGSFYGSYYVAAEDADPVSYLIMSDITVARVYPTLGLPGTLCNTATGACVNIERDAVSTTQGVIILPALEPTMFTPQNDLYNVWPAVVNGYLPAIRFTDCGGEPITGLNNGKYAKIKIPYGSGAPIVDSLAVAWWDGDEWKVNVGIFFGSGAAGFNATAHTVEFWANDLHGIYAVVSNDADPCDGPITVTAAPHDAVTPWANSYTDATPTFNTLVRSNITGNDNNWDVDSLQTHVKLDGITIYNNGANATGWITTWDNVSGLLQTRWNGAAALDEGTDHTYWVQARTFQGCAKSLTVNFEVDETAPTIEWPDDYVCPNPEFRIILKDDGAGIDLDNIQADVYDYDLSLGTEIPSDKLVYEEHASGFEVINGTEEITLVFSLTAENAIYRRYVVVLWDGMEGGRTVGEDDDDRDFSDNKWIYHNDHGVPDLVGNHATPVFRMFTVGGEDCDGVGGDEPYNDPNPFDPWAGEATTIFVGNGDGVSVKIYDLAGEKVIALWENENTFISGTSVKWDGQVDGKIVASGVYLCHISGRNGAGMSFSHVVKIAVVKR